MDTQSVLKKEVVMKITLSELLTDVVVVAVCVWLSSQTVREANKRVLFNYPPTTMGVSCR
jgi:hypothetical protein